MYMQTSKGIKQYMLANVMNVRFMEFSQSQTFEANRSSIQISLTYGYEFGVVEWQLASLE